MRNVNREKGKKKDYYTPNVTMVFVCFFLFRKQKLWIRKMSRIIIIIIWSKSQVPLYMRTIKWGDVNYIFLSSHEILLHRYQRSISIPIRNLRCITYYYSQVPTDFIIILRVEEKGRYVLWPKVFPPYGKEHLL